VDAVIRDLAPMASPRKLIRRLVERAVRMEPEAERARCRFEAAVGAMAEHDRVFGAALSRVTERRIAALTEVYRACGAGASAQRWARLAQMTLSGMYPVRAAARAWSEAETAKVVEDFCRRLVPLEQ
jgi:hypothetical protein